MNSDLRVLTLTHYGNTPEENERVTLSAMSIKLVRAKDGYVQDRPIKITMIKYLDSDTELLNLNELDLLQLENVVGAYGFLEG